MIIKTYSYINLIENKDKILSRIDLIKKLTLNETSYTYFELNDDNIIRKTTRIKSNNINYGKITKSQKIELCRIVTKAFYLGITHGDLNRKNVFIDLNQNIFVSDWEPSLIQIVNGRKTLMGTKPWIDYQDLENKSIGVRTDLVGFYKIITDCNKDFFNSSNWENLILDSLKTKSPFEFLLKNQQI
ncbi:hypothetical protein GW796_00855 [archaeon]|nr:hypothetical protein [archaeon]NCQ50455.1 hypothetical protein [archaeon]